MKRSVHVSAPLLASAALALATTGCRHPEPQRCVDEKNHVVDQSFCQAQGLAQPQNGLSNSQINNQPVSPGYWPYHFYYGGYGGFTPGSIATGGSSIPLSGHSYSTSVRGGFGSSFGGGDAAGGGHGGGGGE